MKKFYIGVKGIIHDPQNGVLLLRDPRIVDVPGGRIDDNETFAETLKREISEELPGSKLIKVHELLGASRLQKDIDENISLALLFYEVDVALAKPIAISEEHEEYFWVNDKKDIPEDTNPDLKVIIEKLLS